MRTRPVTLAPPRYKCGCSSGWVPRMVEFPRGGWPDNTGGVVGLSNQRVSASWYNYQPADARDQLSWWIQPCTLSLSQSNRRCYQSGNAELKRCCGRASFGYIRRWSYYTRTRSCARPMRCVGERERARERLLAVKTMQRYGAGWGHIAIENKKAAAGQNGHVKPSRGRACTYLRRRA